MKFPLSFKSQSTWALVFLSIIGGAAWASTQVNTDAEKYIVGGGFIVGMLLIIGIDFMAARLKGTKYPHAIVTGRTWPTGNPQQKDFFFDTTDPMKRIADVLPLMEVDPATKELVPREWLGRTWYPYLARTEGVVDWWGVASSDLHLFVLPDVWEEFFGHHRREAGAYMLGEVIDHGNSDCVTCYLAPFEHSLLAEPIIVYLGVEGTSTFRHVTKSWEATLEEIARMDMTRVMDDYVDSTWPEKQLDKVVEDSLGPEQKLAIVEMVRRRAAKKK